MHGHCWGAFAVLFGYHHYRFRASFILLFLLHSLEALQSVCMDLGLIARIHPWVSASGSRAWSGGGGQLANSISSAVMLWHLKSGGI